MTHICIVCDHVHDPETEGRWEDLPDDFECPECGVGKEDYVEFSDWVSVSTKVLARPSVSAMHSL